MNKEYASGMLMTSLLVALSLGDRIFVHKGG
jgi:hypothetical protein